MMSKGRQGSVVWVTAFRREHTWATWYSSREHKGRATKVSAEKILRGGRVGQGRLGTSSRVSGRRWSSTNAELHRSPEGERRSVRHGLMPRDQVADPRSGTRSWLGDYEKYRLGGGN